MKRPQKFDYRSLSVCISQSKIELPFIFAPIAAQDSPTIIICLLSPLLFLLPPLISPPYSVPPTDLYRPTRLPKYPFASNKKNLDRPVVYFFVTYPFPE